MGVLFCLALAVQDDWSPLRSFDLAARDFYSSRCVDDLGVRLRVWDADAQSFDLSLDVSAKIPFERERDLLRAGTTDVALAAVARFPAGVHVEIGTTLPWGEAEDVDLASFAFVGAGLTWRLSDTVTAGFQLEVNTSAFRDVDVLNRHPASAVFGLHALGFEAGLGIGVDRIAGYPWMAYVGVAIRF
jgi:hypothetical protein